MPGLGPAEDAMHKDSRYTPLRGRRVCVTGGAGFIGSHLVDALVGIGASVVVLDDFSHGQRENLSGHTRDVDIEILEASVLDRGALSRAVANADVVFHHAAVTSVPRSVREPARSHEVNAVGTQMVLEACRSANVRRVIYAASSSAYGERGSAVKMETMSPRPMSPYAAAKCAGEHLLHAYAHCYDVDGLSLRYFNIFGPRQRADSAYAAVIPRFIEMLRAGEQPTIFGDGTQTRDFTHVANAVHANLLAATCHRRFHGEVVNVACGAATTLNALTARLAHLLEVEANPVFGPARAGEVLHSQADVTVARSLLGYEVIMSLDSGLRDIVDSMIS